MSSTPQNQTYFYMGADHGPAIILLVLAGTALIVFIGIFLLKISL